MALKNYQTVTIGEAARKTGASIKQIRHWAECGYISEPGRVICGERSYRQFAELDLVVIRSIKELLDEGFTLKAAARKAGVMRKNDKGGR